MSGERNLGLDLVRAIAITLVLVSHWGDTVAVLYGGRAPAWLSFSGLFGVELFFVLSGLLIGGLLLRIVEAGPSWQAWRVFMMRRWMRTLPLYFTWLIVLALFWRPTKDFWGHVVRYALFLQNLAWPMPRDNWFGVSWSLTIEEWFYLLFSTALIGGALALGRRRAVWLALGLFLAVPAAARWLAAHALGIGAAYPVALLRLDAIAYGVVLAKLRTDGSAVFQHPWLALGGGLALVLGVWTEMATNWLPIPGWLFQGVFLTATSIGFCLCLSAAIRLRSGLGWAGVLVRRLSEISYGIYIMHLSVLEVVEYGWAQGRLSRIPTIALMTALPIVLAALSFRFFETPILAHRPRQVFESMDGWGRGRRLRDTDSHHALAAGADRA